MRYFLITILIIFYSCKLDNELVPVDEDRVKDILDKMTIEEKIGQMAQINLTVIAKGPSKWRSFYPLEIDPKRAKKAIVDYKVGSIINTINGKALETRNWHQSISEIQKYSVDSTRSRIPIIYGIDGIHGSNYAVGATMFPHQINLAASWNKENAYNMANVCAYETRAIGIPWNFSPILDLGIDPRFPRQFETFGEDPLLVQRLSKAMLRGFQGNENEISNYNVAACLKHFVGYQSVISGKDRTPAYIPDHVLSEYHIEPFREAIKDGAKSVMISSGLINGIPVHANYDLIIKILRQKLGFEGVILSDWEDINKLHTRDKVAESKKEAVKIAINSGIDMSMIPYDYEQYCRFLLELVNEGEVSIERINDAVSRILKLKLDLGLFENPITDFSKYEAFGSKKHKELAYNAASESITLLKNKNRILPIKGNPSILVTGPNANSMRTLNGAWTYSWQGNLADEFAGEYNTIYEAISNKFGSRNVKFIPGVAYTESGNYFDMNEVNIRKAVDEGKKSDIIILCLGENSYTEKPGDLNDLNIHKLQSKLAFELIKTRKPIILIINSGRPRLITDFEPFMSAVINVYLPGNHGGDALADILSGKVNPSGKLPFTYPAFPNSLLPYYYKPSEVQNNNQGAYNYVGKVNNLYDFGYGLSYSEFEYTNLNTDKDVYNSKSDTIKINFKIKNTSKIDGYETVQLYSSDLYAQITPDIKRLRDFRKIFLRSGESKSIDFSLPVEKLGYFNVKNNKITEKGEFKLMIDTLTSLITIN